MRRTQMEHVACPLCGSWQHKLVFTRPDYTHQVSTDTFSIVRCKECRFVFVNPRPSPVAIGRYYPPDFYDTSITPDQLLQQKQETINARLTLLDGLQIGRALDVGCQKGEFLYALKQQGWDVAGIEFSQTPPNLFNLPIFHGVIEDAPYEESSFDLITMWAVLEHVHDPMSVLSAVSRLLKPSGRAFVLVPNFNSIPGRFLRHDDVPRHLLMFTKRTFREAAKRSGLRVRRYAFGDNIFSGSTRGVLNYIWKLLHGEKLTDIVAQNRTPGRWGVFANYVNGRESDLMLKIDRLDIRLTPYLDRLVNWLELGFIMTAELVRLDTGESSDTDQPH